MEKQIRQGKHLEQIAMKLGFFPEVRFVKRKTIEKAVATRIREAEEL
jgi:hypothetical protein